VSDTTYLSHKELLNLLSRMLFIPYNGND